MPYGAHCLTVMPSAWVRVWLPRLLRLAFWLRAIRLWRFLPGPARTLPVAVILNRFLTEDLVFSLGIWVSLLWTCPAWVAGNAGVAAGHARSRPGLADGWGCSGWCAPG